MIFHETPIPGAYIIDLQPHNDPRGFFSRIVCRDEFSKYGLNSDFAQQNMSWNPICGTMRGLHYQAEPNGEIKLVRVTRGAIWDVIVDIRADSPTHGKWYGVELNADNRRQLYIPRGFGHGYVTLRPDTEVFYQMSAPYVAEGARGIMWNDPTLAISWPEVPGVSGYFMSERDKNLPSFAQATRG